MLQEIIITSEVVLLGKECELDRQRNMELIEDLPCVSAMWGLIRYAKDVCGHKRKRDGYICPR